MELAGGHVMNSNGPETVEKTSKIKIRIRRKAEDGKEDGVRDNATNPTCRTSFNLHKQMSSDANNKLGIIDARSNSPLGHFHKRWMNMSHSPTSSKSLPTSPNHTSHMRIQPWKSFERYQSFSHSPTLNKNKSNESDASSIASNDSAFEDSASGISSKSWRPGMNYKPTHPLYLPQPDRRRSSVGSGDSTTPTPGTPEMDKTFSSADVVQNPSHTKSRHQRRTTEPASQVQLNIENKEFSKEEKQILEGFFQTSSKTSGERNFINSAVYKEKVSGDLDTPSLQPLKVKPLTPNFDRSVEERTKDNRVRVFPDNSPMTVVSDFTSARVSSLVKHFDTSVSPLKASHNSDDNNSLPQRPRSASKSITFHTRAVPRNSSDMGSALSSNSEDLTASPEIVKSKPYETNLFQTSANRQAFLNTYLDRMHSSRSSAQLLGHNSRRPPLTTPDMKRGSLKRFSEDNTLQQMRPMSTSVLLTKQDTFTNDPYKRRSFLNKYLTRQGETSLINKKITT
eukprot:TRINITY_DN21867_c0_g1_i1.p1 TRINITY_DN21867_c0_g1~~TRINITY_DN21867_c0_g1_i1.p1  ORF type:complete len:509 (-),score=96.14 TRINITY_DN21867_c0_g1_i1:260-1786(-)